MKNYILKLLGAFILILLMHSACKKSNDSKPADPGTGNNNNPPIVSLEDTICRNWEVISATHNGSNDGSSVGLKMNFKKDGTYILYSSSYMGTWEFIEQSAKVLLDKNEPSYKTTWTIVSLSSKKLQVKFKSPFTGGAAEWVMRAY